MLTHHLLDSLAVIGRCGARPTAAHPAAGCRLGRRTAGRGALRSAARRFEVRLRGHGRQEGRLHPAGGGHLELAQPARRARPGRKAERALRRDRAPAPSPRWPTSSPGHRRRWREQGVWMAMKGKHPSEEIAALPPRLTVFHVEQLLVPRPGRRTLHRLDAAARPGNVNSAFMIAPGVPMFGVADYGAFVAAIIVFLAIPGPGNLALITSTGKGGIARRLGRDARRHRRRPGADVAGGGRRGGAAAGLPGGLPCGAVAGRRLPGLAGPADAAGQARRQAGAAHRAAPLLPAGVPDHPAQPQGDRVLHGVLPAVRRSGAAPGRADLRRDGGDHRRPDLPLRA